MKNCSHLQKCLLVLLFLLASIESSCAYRAQHFENLEIPANNLKLVRLVMYTLEDAPGIKDKPPYITISTTIGSESIPGFVIFVAEADLLSSIELEKACYGGLQNDPNGLWVFNPSSSFKSGEIAPPRSGVYYVGFKSCSVDIVVPHIYVVAENPYGALPGDEYPLYPFFGSLAAAYLVIGAIWAYFSFKHMDHLLPLQYCITVVIFLNMLESATWYFNYLTWNMHGHIVEMGYVGGVFMSALKRTGTRVLLLLIALGYSVTKANLGIMHSRLQLLAIIYLIISAAQQWFDIQSKAALRLNEQLQAEEGYLTVVVALLELVFWWWTLLAVLATLAQVRMRGQLLKEILYRKFLYALVFAAIVSLSLMLVGTISIDAQPDVYWPITWLFDTGFWDALNFVLLLYVAFLWLPSADNSAYAFGEVHDEGHELASVSSPIAAEHVILRRERVGDGVPPSAPVATVLAKDDLIDALTSFAMDDEERQEIENPRNAKIE